MQPKLDPRKLVFIDETAASTNMTRRYGRATRGERLVCKVPHGHWKTSTFVAALRHNRVTAPFLVDGPMNGTTFLAYLEDVRPSSAVTSSSSITSVSTRSPASAKPSKHAAPPCSICAVQPRPQPDRAILLGTQGAAAQGGGSDNRHVVGRHRLVPHRLLAARVRDLPHQFRIQPKRHST
jgi:DDE superfamily endonuclease